MRRSDRLFDIIQRLRTASKPTTAATLADELEVTPRTVYRDIATLQARRVPIEGAAGVGYVLRRGFDLPPLMFTIDEIEAIAVGARMVQRVRDSELQHAAARVLDKVTVVLPESLRGHVVDLRALRLALNLVRRSLRRRLRLGRLRLGRRMVLRRLAGRADAGLDRAEGVT